MRNRRGGLFSRRHLIVVATIGPAVALLLLFLGVPMVEGVRLSFSSWGGTGPITWAGLSNYRSMFSQGFTSSLWLTLKYSLLSMVGIIVISAGLAAAVSGGVKGSRFYRVIWFLPGIAPLSAVAVFWSSAFQPVQGAANAALGAIGLGDNHAWLGTPSDAIYPIIFVTIWVSVGFAFLLLLGAMEQVPVSLYEAARLDGASALRMFRSVTLPLIKPVITVVALLELIWNFNGFTTIWGMSEGGPGYSTSTLPIIVYKQAFQETNFGLASAMAVVSGVILIVIGIVALRISRNAQT
jgi:ABC-type sugar transport system permease subunit